MRHVATATAAFGPCSEGVEESVVDPSNSHLLVCHLSFSGESRSGHRAIALSDPSLRSGCQTKDGFIEVIPSKGASSRARAVHDLNFRTYPTSSLISSDESSSL